MVNNMTTYYEHTPVMLQECIEHLITDPNGSYIDATLGGGGHTLAILEKLGPQARVFGVDQDQQAIDAASQRIGEDSRCTILKGNFGYLSTLLPPPFKGQVAGILLDLGVSTHQLKEADRGFSFQQEGPLDMRMGTYTGLTAYDVVNTYDYERLRDLIFHYGEERGSRKIAQSIIDARPIESTQELSTIISKQVPPKFRIKSLARVFQAIRIEVNQELEVLKQVLQQGLELLAPGGRMVVMSYHSLEDRLVKNFMKSGNFEGIIEKDFYGNPVCPLTPINRQVITPNDQEIDRNPASRSAKLRVAEKVGDPGS